MIPKLSEPEYKELKESCAVQDWQIRAIESAVHRQYKEWVAKQDPFGYFHELIKNGGGVWLGLEGKETEDVVRRASDPGETGDVVIPLFAHPAPDDANVRDAEAELNCAEEVLESLSIDLPMEETGFDCLGDYVTAVFEAQKKKGTELLKQALDACNALEDYLHGPTAWTQEQEDAFSEQIHAAIKALRALPIGEQK